MVFHMDSHPFICLRSFYQSLTLEFIRRPRASLSGPIRTWTWAVSVLPCNLEVTSKAQGGVRPPIWVKQLTGHWSVSDCNTSRLFHFLSFQDQEIEEIEVSLQEFSHLYYGMLFTPFPVSVTPWRSRFEVRPDSSPVQLWLLWAPPFFPIHSMCFQLVTDDEFFKPWHLPLAFKVSSPWWISRAIAAQGCSTGSHAWSTGRGWWVVSEEIHNSSRPGKSSSFHGPRSCATWPSAWRNLCCDVVR